jgi:hypothetical protein
MALGLGVGHPILAPLIYARGGLGRTKLHARFPPPLSDAHTVVDSTVTWFSPDTTGAMRRNLVEFATRVAADTALAAMVR